MEIKVTIQATQNFGKHTQTEVNYCKGEATYLEKEEILEFTEKQEQEEIQFKLVITEDKIISVRNGQQMIFDLENEDHIKYETPQGSIPMSVNTQQIQVTRENNVITQIRLLYTITMQEQQSYSNEVIFSIEEC